MSPLKIGAGLLGALLATLALLGPASAFAEIECFSASIAVEGQEFLIGTYDSYQDAYDAALENDITWPAYKAAMRSALFTFYCADCEDPDACKGGLKHNGVGFHFDIVPTDDGQFELWGLPDPGTLWWLECSACTQPTEG